MHDARLAVELILVLAFAGVLARLIFLIVHRNKQMAEIKTQLQQAVLREQALHHELSEYKDKFIQEALCDPLTNLPSLAVFKDQLQLLLKHCELTQEIFGVLFIDLRNFSIVNNTFGYTVGDFLLKEVANRLQASIRYMDKVCRFSGDTFVVLLSKLTQKDSATLAVHRFLQKLAEPIYIETQALSTPASVGIAIYPKDGKDMETLFKNAARALTCAKKAGAQEYRFYHAELQEITQHEFLLNARLSQATLFEELQLTFQPEVKVSDNHIVCWQTLLHWQHPDLGFIPAAEFMAMAESRGQIVAIGEWVIEKVCRQLQAWSAAGYVLPTISINLSLQQLVNHHFVSFMLRILQETRIDPKLLIFEISEQDFLKSTALSEKNFAFIEQWGIRLTLEHFSASETILHHLEKTAVYGFKIGRHLINNLPNDKKSHAIIAMMVALAKQLDKQLIATGVETNAQKELLQQLGCSLMQGDFFSKPVTVEEMMQKFSKQQSSQQLPLG